jgi:Ca-activated chloride channel homolog
MTRAIASVLLTVLVLGAPPVTAQTFRSNTQGVRVDVLVTDRGKPVGGLTVDDFELFDNGLQQTITLADFDQLPLNVVLAFDMSSSVTRERLGHLQRAAGTLLDALTKQDQAGLITFSNALVLRHSLTKNLPQLRDALARVEPAGTTALVDGIYAGMMLGEAGVGRALLIVFSDGVDTASWLTSDSVLQTAKRSDVVTYGVSVGRQKPEFLRDLGEATGGQVFENESAGNLEQRFLSVLDEFRRRYVLMYSPTSTDPGWHRLEVRVKGRRGTVRSRPGYLADTPSTAGK